MDPRQLGSEVTADVSTEEVRVAMALNGGVSLAVWMGGCAVEFDCARRAHVGPAPESGPGGVYRMLCSVLERALVIDIMSGASAGGINGALLAAVISRGRRLDPAFLRNRWIELGDFSGLLQPLSTREPRSLMSGDVFHKRLVETFDIVLGQAADDESNKASAVPIGQRPAELQPVLDVTTTDLAGKELLFRDDWGETLAAREYRACFRFRVRDDYTSTNLAMAARASASFPLAFEPWKVAGDDPCRLADFPRSRWVIDGGVLDNAPIRLALEAIPARPAHGQVRRYVCYVNGDPPERTPGDDGVPPEPGLEGVIGAILTLPRKAPFADQLMAIEAASRGSSINGSAEIPLLGIDLDALATTATGLLSIYRDRRRLSSLQDILGQPRDAEVAFQRVRDAGELPWIPTSFDVPAPNTWGWGIQAVRRAHHLMLDLIRLALPDGKDDGRAALLEARIEIDARLSDLDSRQKEFESSPCVVHSLQRIACDRHADVALELASLAGFAAPRDAALYSSVADTIVTIYRVSVQLGALDGVAVGIALFGEGWTDSTGLSEEMVNHFLRRVLAIELVRRAFSAREVIDEAQDLAFAQLTPCAPTPILSSMPLTRTPQLTPRQKLTGVILGHFGAFYRSSWRANDFMWGRLDGASRVVNMLLETRRARELHKRYGKQPWDGITEALLEGADEDRRWLIAEALDDAGCPPDPDLDARLRNALEQDMNRECALTRAICIRAAQLEILREELPELIARATQDEREGCSPNKLGLGTPQELSKPEGMIAAVKALRQGDPLPKRLGLNDSAEATSTLAIRTIARAGLVSLAVLRGGVPFAQPAQVARAVLLPVSGAVAQHWYNRLGVMLAFVASAWFLAARAVTTLDKPADLSHLSGMELVVTLIAVLVVVGTAAVPLYRLVRGPTVRTLRSISDRAIQGIWVTLLLGAGVLATIILSVTGSLNLGQLIVQPGAKAVPSILLAPTALIVLGIIIAPVPLIRSQLAKLAGQAWSGGTSLALSLIAAACVIGWAQEPLRHAIWHGHGWQQAAAIVAGAGAPVVSLAFLILRDPVKRSLNW